MRRIPTTNGHYDGSYCTLMWFNTLLYADALKGKKCLSKFAMTQNLRGIKSGGNVGVLS